MKRVILALAACAATGVAFAQGSSVQIFGIMDVDVTYGKGSIANAKQVMNSGYNSSRLGFRGTEDLGDGLYAGFWLEGALNPDEGSGSPTNTNNQSTGATTGFSFGRKTHLTFGGRWGELRMGRDYTPIYSNKSAFDTFGTNGVGSSQIQASNIGGFTSVRASNSVGYFLPPDLGGFYGTVMHFRGENDGATPNPHDGTGTGVRLGYNNGKLNVAVATQRTMYLSGNIITSNTGASYNAGFATFRILYDRDKVEGGLTGHGGLAGVNVPIGLHELRASYSFYQRNSAGDPKVAKFALGYVYNFSKRTLVYATGAHVKNTGGSAFALNAAKTAANEGSSGFDLGIMHLF